MISMLFHSLLLSSFARSFLSLANRNPRRAERTDPLPPFRAAYSYQKTAPPDS